MAQPAGRRHAGKQLQSMSERLCQKSVGAEDRAGLDLASSSAGGGSGQHTTTGNRLSLRGRGSCGAAGSGQWISSGRPDREYQGAASCSSNSRARSVAVLEVPGSRNLAARPIPRSLRIRGHRSMKRNLDPAPRFMQTCPVSWMRAGGLARGFWVKATRAAADRGDSDGGNRACASPRTKRGNLREGPRPVPGRDMSPLAPR